MGRKHSTCSFWLFSVPNSLNIPISIPMVILSSYLFMLLLLEFQRFHSKEVWIGSFAARGSASANTLFWSFWSAETLFWWLGQNSFHHAHFKGSCRNGIIWSCKVAVEVNSKLFMCLLKPLLTSWAINLPRHKFLCAHLDRKEVKLVTRDSEITPTVNLIKKL